MTERHEIESPEWASRGEHERRLRRVELLVGLNLILSLGLFVGLVTVCALLRAQWQHPAEAINDALDDAEDHAEDAPYLCYVWNPDASPVLTRLTSYVTNSALADLRESRVMRPVVLAGGHVLRLDLRTLGDTNRLRGTLAEFSTDQRLYSRSSGEGPAATRDAVGPGFALAKDADLRSGNQSLGTIPKGSRIVPLKRETREGIEWLQVEHGGKSGWIRGDLYAPANSSPTLTSSIVFGSHLGHEAVGTGLVLQKLTAADVPLIEANEFCRRLLTDLGDGLYSKALGLPPDYDEFLKLVGADRKATAAAEAERRAAMFFSGVTRSQRSISFLPIVGAPVDSPRVHVITEDIGKEDTKVDQQPIRNLLGSKFRAGEAMTTTLNGRIIWTLWAFDANGKGTLAKSVPDDIAANARVTPEDRRLQSQLDCLECHTARGEDGWKPWTNDARELLAAVYADKRTSHDVELVRKLRARYDWEPGPSVRSWRDSFAAFLAACDPLPANAEGAKQTPDEFGNALRLWRGEYLESPVTSQRAAAELGLTAQDEAAAIKILRERIEDRPDGIDDPVLIRLRLPAAKVTRTDWNQVWPEAIRRLKPAGVQP